MKLVFFCLATPKVPLPSPEISDVGDNYIGIRWNKVDVPAFDMDETPLSFMIEAQSVPDYDWKPVARGVTGASHKVCESFVHRSKEVFLAEGMFLYERPEITF